MFLSKRRVVSKDTIEAICLLYIFTYQNYKTMNVYIYRQEILGMVIEQVSRYADIAVDDKGQSLYDFLELTSKDDKIINDYINTCINDFIKRTSDISKYVKEKDDIIHLEFNVPNFDTSNIDMFKFELNYALALGACSLYMLEKHQEQAKNAMANAQDHLNKAIYFLKTIKQPSRDDYKFKC